MKTFWAETHLKELDRLIREFVENPYTITRKDNAKKFRHIIRIEFKPVDYSIAMHAGEFAYSLRSGLDQLAWQLALLHTKPKRPRSHTSFPIWGNAPAKGFGDATKDILPAAIPVIESLQPYQRGTAFQSHPLYILNELCIIDKHMILPVNSQVSRASILGADVVSQRDFEYAIEIAVSLSDKYKAEIEPSSTDIIFGQPITTAGSQFEVRIATLRAIRDFVRDDVVPRFAGFFK